MSEVKKIIINIICGVLIAGASFCAGRFIRFGRVSATSQQLIDGIVLSRDTADKLANELNLGGNALKSGVEFGRAISEGVRTIRKSSEVGELCADAIKQSIEADERFNQEIRELDEGYFEATNYAIDLAIKRAELYESIVRAYEQAVDNNGENNKEPE